MDESDYEKDNIATHYRVRDELFTDTEDEAEQDLRFK
jgi:hypothetical protein